MIGSRSIETNVNVKENQLEGEEEDEQFAESPYAMTRDLTLAVNARTREDAENLEKKYLRNLVEIFDVLNTNEI